VSPLQKFLITWSLALVSGWLTLKALSYVGELISILLTASLIAFLLNYPVVALKSVLPRSIAAALVYITSALVVALLLVTLLPPVINQAGQLVTNFPILLEQSQEKLASFQVWSNEHNLPINVELLISQFIERMQSIAGSTAKTGVNVVLGTFDWIVDLIFILVISFYMLIDGERLWNLLTGILNPIIQTELTAALQRNLNQFVTGQLLLGAFMAVILSVAFWLLNVPFFLLFAVFIGLMELIPFIGATLGIGTVAIVVLFINVWLALKILIVSVVIQQVKDNLIAPKVMGNLTGLSPILIFISLLIGARVGGLLGVILAIPLTGAAKSLAEVVVDPMLPPQTGSFFRNPLQREKMLEVRSEE
jgi:predicted PurR-regulated permease PerM